eukprot:TRINITY_DN3294_c0_g1_i3.p2 TRINITY_DN3294_c0_g1~~TRINITY_DN3294_c0_g1_i3.p2  ORF type:complete len:147 (+),score=19.21 TRINITY_DN3294_c0_g1_i3:1409-1849(+)
MNPGTTATASSISFRRPTSAADPHATAFLLPTHLSLAGDPPSVCEPAESRRSFGTTASTTTAAGISPLLPEMSPELEALGQSSDPKREEALESVLSPVGAASSSESGLRRDPFWAGSSCPRSMKETLMCICERERERERGFINFTK